MKTKPNRVINLLKDLQKLQSKHNITIEVEFDKISVMFNEDNFEVFIDRIDETEIRYNTI